MKTRKVHLQHARPAYATFEASLPTGDLCWDGYTHCKQCGEEDAKKRKWAMCEYFDNNHKNRTCVPYCDLFRQHLAYTRKKSDDVCGEVPRLEHCRRLTKPR